MLVKSSVKLFVILCGNIDVALLLLSNEDAQQLLLMADKRNITALSHAVHWGHLQVTRNLIQAGSSADVTEHINGYSLLLLAASEANAPMVELLL